MLLHPCNAGGQWKALPFSAQGLRVSQGLFSMSDEGGSFLLPALGRLTLPNDLGWVQGFASSAAVGGDVTDQVYLKGKNLLSRKQNHFFHPRGLMHFFSRLPRRKKGGGCWELKSGCALCPPRSCVQSWVIAYLTLKCWS